MPNRLTKLKVDFVSLVDRPANQPAVHVLAKRDSPEEQLTVPNPPVATLEVAGPVVNGISKADMDAAIAAAIQKANTDNEEKLAKAAETVEKLNKALEETTQRAQAAEQIAKAEQEAREVTVAISKAEREMPALPGTTPTEVGPLLRLVSKALDADNYAKLETILKAASVAVSKGELFREQGSSYPTGGINGTGGSQCAQDQIQKVAAEMREKDSSLTPAGSIVKAMEARPDLVKQDRVEKGFIKG